MASLAQKKSGASAILSVCLSVCLSVSLSLSLSASLLLSCGCVSMYMGACACVLQSRIIQFIFYIFSEKPILYFFRFISPEKINRSES